MRATIKMAAIAVFAFVLTACSDNPSVLDAQPRGFTSGGFIPGPGKSGGGGSGTVTSVSGGTGVTVTNPTTTPNVALDSTVWQSRVTGNAAAHNAITAIAAAGTVSTATFFDSTSFPVTTCTNGQVVTAHAADGTATCSDPAINNYGSKHWEASNEWMFGQTGGAISDGDWIGSLANAGTAQPNAAGTTTRAGVYQISISTTASSRYTIQYGGVNYVDFGSANWTWEWVGGFQALSNATDEYIVYTGFGDNITSANQVDGCGFVYDRANTLTNGNNSGNASDWECYCSNNSVRTVYLMNGQTEAVGDGSFVTVTAPVAALTLPDTNMNHLKLVEVSSNEMDFLYNGVKSCVIKTNIPTGAARTTGANFSILRTAGTTTARNVDIDYTRIAFDLAAARSP